MAPEPAAGPRHLVIGLGNPILGDDGVGWHVARAFASQLSAEAVEVDCLAVGGLSLMERMVGYERVVLVDAIATGEGRTGAVRSFPIEELPDPMAGHSGSTHDTSLRTAMDVARSMGARLPERVTVVAIEAGPRFDFSSELSPETEAAIPEAVRLVREALGLPPAG